MICLLKSCQRMFAQLQLTLIYCVLTAQARTILIKSAIQLLVILTSLDHTAWHLLLFNTTVRLLQIFHVQCSMCRFRSHQNVLSKQSLLHFPLSVQCDNFIKLNNKTCYFPQALNFRQRNLVFWRNADTGCVFVMTLMSHAQHPVAPIGEVWNIIWVLTSKLIFSCLEKSESIRLRQASKPAKIARCHNFVN